MKEMLMAFHRERKIKDRNIDCGGERNIFNNIKIENVLMLKVGDKIFSDYQSCQLVKRD
jgi:hypothetical protein